MKVLFLNAPTWKTQLIPHRAVRPLAPSILSAILYKMGHESAFIDCDAMFWGWDDIKQTISEMEPDVIGISALYNNRFAVAQLAKDIKIFFPSVKLIGGGPFATTSPEVLISWGFDSVCVGEAELVLEKVLNERGIIQGIQVEDLNSLPFPAYDVCFPHEKVYYGSAPYWEKPESWLLISRGCRHNCSFCCNPLFNHQLPRFMSPSRVKEELQIIKNREIKHVYLYSDELIGASPVDDKWFESVCAEIADVGLTYKVQGRCNRKLEESTFEAAKEAGIKSIGWGVESLSSKILRNFNKGIEPEDAWNALRMAKKYGIINWVFIIVGGVEETADDFEETRKGLLEMKKEGLIGGGQTAVMTVEPGSRLWDRALNEGWISNSEQVLSHWSPTLKVPWASDDELTRRARIVREILEGQRYV